jgi:hypothetical protein
MTIIGLLIFILILALLFWLTNLIPDARGQTIARVAIVVFAVIWLLNMLGVLGGLGSVRLQ